MSAAKERPILFSAPMVRALLDGSKTQTRRVVKRIPWLAGVNPNFSQARPFNNGPEWRIAGSEEMTGGFLCPYGQPSDRLWVRETLRCHRHAGDRGGWLYSADNAQVTLPQGHACADEMRDWARQKKGDGCVSIHMPRWASRITLEITGVRVERLQDISEADALAEGSQEPSLVPITGARLSERSVYAAPWESISGPGSWDANPWVWVVSFKRVTP